MLSRRSATITLGAVVASVGLLVTAAPSHGQIIDLGRPTTTTTTTAPPESTTTTTTSPAPTSSAPPPSSTPPPSSAPTAPPEAGAGADAGDAGPVPDGPRTVPADAQRIIDSVQRTPPNNSADLHAAVQELVALGLEPDEAMRIGFGRFPVAGVAKYSHDWLYPRWGPGFRFHHGTDIFAPFGTPLRAVVDGTVTSNNSALGGLSTKIHTDDGTYFYYAHLSSLPEGFTNGMAVETGDIIGYVGDSGNAKGTSPHVHFAIYPQGGAPTDPKPILDGFLAEAAEALPGIVEQVRTQQAAAEAAPVTRTPRSLLATSLLRPLTDRTAATDVSTEILYQAAGNPSGAGVSVAESEAERLAASIDWDASATRAAAEARMRDRTSDFLENALGLLTPRRSTTGGGETAAG